MRPLCGIVLGALALVPLQRPGTPAVEDPFRVFTDEMLTWHPVWTDVRGPRTHASRVDG